jgi:hypothetical protein
MPAFPVATSHKVTGTRHDGRLDKKSTCGANGLESMMFNDYRFAGQ